MKYRVIWIHSVLTFTREVQEVRPYFMA